MKNEVIYNLSFAEYQAIDAVNFSTLKNIARSPAYYKYKLNNPDPETDAMILGRAVHTAILETDKFTSQYTSYTGRRAGNHWAEFQHANEDKTILPIKDFDLCMNMLCAAKRHQLSGAILNRENLRTEVTCVWVDPVTDIKCKARLDWCADTIGDVKTTGDPTEYSFQRDCVKYRYFTQFAFYEWGYSLCTGNHFPFQVMAIGKPVPHEVVLYDVVGDAINHGQTEYRAMLDLLSQCIKDDEWGEYCQDEPIALNIPIWCKPFGDNSDDSDPFENI